MEKAPEAPIISEFKPVFNPEPISLDMVRAAKAEASGAKDMQDHLREVQSDAPACNVCGHITVRSGTCYKCLNCGNSLGCS